MENLSSGIIATELLLRVTNVMAHGPGIKLLHGLEKAPLGIRPTLTVAGRIFVQHIELEEI